MLFRKTLIAIALVAATACTANSNTSISPSGNTSAASIVLNASVLTTTAFSPNPIVVKVGDTVTWTNNDTVAHTVIANGGAFASGTINPGGTFSAKMNSAGTFTYHDSTYAGMVGTVTVS